MNRIYFDDYEQLAHYFDVKRRTVRKNLIRIKGLSVRNGKISILEGTRYPFNLGNSKLDTREKKVYALLRAIEHFMYIDKDMLKVDKSSFDCMISELLSKGLIQDNGNDNPYGANKYDTTLLYDEYVRQKKIRSYKDIAIILGALGGEFCSRIIMNNQ